MGCYHIWLSLKRNQWLYQNVVIMWNLSSWISLLDITFFMYLHNPKSHSIGVFIRNFLTSNTLFCSENYSVRVPLACQANKEISPDRQGIPIKHSGSSTKLKSRSKIATKPLSANPKEHDVDDLLERTLTEGNQSDPGIILTQVMRNILIITYNYAVLFQRSNPWHGYLR